MCDVMSGLQKFREHKRANLIRKFDQFYKIKALHIWYQLPDKGLEADVADERFTPNRYKISVELKKRLPKRNYIKFKDKLFRKKIKILIPG